MKVDKLILILAFGTILTACITQNNNIDYPKPTYMDSVNGITLQPIESISYYVGPLSHEWFVDFANGEKGIIGYDRSLPNHWTFRARFDTTRSFPLTGHSDAFVERYGIAEEDLIKIMDHVNANGIVLLCGPSCIRWEEEYASAIYEYHDDTLDERLVLFDAIDDSIRFIYNIEKKKDKKIFQIKIQLKLTVMEYEGTHAVQIVIPTSWSLFTARHTLQHSVFQQTLCNV